MMLLNYEETIFLKESEKKTEPFDLAFDFFLKQKHFTSQAKPNTLGSTTKRTQLFRLPCENHVLVNYIQLSFFLHRAHKAGGIRQDSGSSVPWLDHKANAEPDCEREKNARKERERENPRSPAGMCVRNHLFALLFTSF
jgi:hypothetical protein